MKHILLIILISSILSCGTVIRKDLRFKKPLKGNLDIKSISYLFIDREEKLINGDLWIKSIDGINIDCVTCLCTLLAGNHTIELEFLDHNYNENYKRILQLKFGNKNYYQLFPFRDKNEKLNFRLIKIIKKRIYKTVPRDNASSLNFLKGYFSSD